MVTSGQAMPYRLAHAIRKKDAQVVSEHRVAHCRLYTYARRAAGDDQMFDSECSEPLVQVSFVEAAETGL